MQTTLLLLLLFPLVWPFVAKLIWPSAINWQEVGINIVLVVLVVGITWQFGKYSGMHDTEVWNGELISKARTEGTYEEAYDCMCTTDSKGNEHCSTCYETHYTVDWDANTTVGGISFDHEDSTWSSVYNDPDPSSYTKAKKGDPVAMEKSFMNYIKGAPQSLFHSKKDAIMSYANQIPPYPRVYDFYHINRVMSVGSSISLDSLHKLNTGLSEMLKTLGHQKQVNIYMIVTGIKDPSYRYAVENAWLGGKKNDVVIFVGIDSDQKIVWDDVMTWALNSGNELFHVKMRDDIKAIGQIDPDKMLAAIKDNVVHHYDRPHMKQFEYLLNQVNPPTWLLWLCIILSVGGSVGLSIVFKYNDVDFLNRNPYNRYRRR